MERWFAVKINRAVKEADTDERNPKHASHIEFLTNRDGRGLRAVPQHRVSALRNGAEDIGPLIWFDTNITAAQRAFRKR